MIIYRAADFANTEVKFVGLQPGMGVERNVYFLTELCHYHFLNLQIPL